MDAIQKTLIEAGRKDLARVYYHKVTGKVPSVLKKISKMQTWLGNIKDKQKMLWAVDYFANKLKLGPKPKNIDDKDFMKKVDEKIKEIFK